MNNHYEFKFYTKDNFESLLKIVLEFRQHLDREKKKTSTVDKEKEERRFLKANSSDKNYRFYLCLNVKKEVVGFSWFGKQDADRTKGFIGELFVKPRHRKKGIATRLLYEAKKWIKENNCTEIEIDVFTADKDAIFLYEKLGYKRQKYYSVTYKKKL